ncbi:helix-turn-helix transcriptional regulator [Leucobacter sp. CSA1]|uniref:Helix-turn-helix transcriptional regulator n=1 Tax=Leucobacter chromiisoli TaxID=2796471 RepID=A0A934Q708_9MICO|nr:TetR family transcriptional regulator [Leucobacter chromiisoli]MBK0417727.1 helix-turn-helix transcriptional regulator [Leucobacter chromiisoli]
MDPRQLRTRNKLRQTLHRLAAAKPISRVTVAEIARDAGVTRDTVYRHGSDPVQLLADFLGEELRALGAGAEPLPAIAPPGRTVFDDGERELLEHITRHAAIYRNALCPRLIGPVRDILIDRLSEGLRAHLDAHPEIAPAAAIPPETAPAATAPPPGGGSLDDETRTRMLVAYAAAGTVAAIEEWLRAGDLDAPEAAASAVIAASPEWWLGRR